MHRRRWGLLATGAGVALVLTGLVGALLAAYAGDRPPAAQATTSSAGVTPAVTTAGETISTPTVRTTTTPPATTTTTTVVTTTVSTIPEGVVNEFVEAFARALEEGDVSFVLGTLHPEVIETFGADVCQEWVASEVMTLTDYELVGDVLGPMRITYTTPVGDITLEETFTASVRFVFDGTSFESTAGFGWLDGSLYWLGQCTE